jgi:alpha-beta hydrolase superfamily lysophospholipase
MNKMLGKAGKLLLFCVAGYFCIGLILIYWPMPDFPEAAPAPATPPATDQSPPAYTQRFFTMRDGKRLFARVIGAEADTTVILVHGFGVSSEPYQRAAALWNQSSAAQIVALDLRGHGKSDGMPGMTDYVGQYADDLADVINAMRKERRGKIVLAGHSMGGGIVLNYALAGQSLPDAYLLISPLLGNNAPTAPATGGPAEKPSNFYLRLPRLIGILMYTLTGIRTFDSLPVMYLNQTPPMTYGFAAISSMAPADYRSAFKAIDAPLLLVTGSKDEVFRSEAYADIVHQYSSGKPVMVAGADHVGALTAPAALAEIGNYIESLDSPASRDIDE